MSNEENKTTEERPEETIKHLPPEVREALEALEEERMANLLDKIGHMKNTEENTTARMLKNAGIKVSGDRLNNEPHRVLPDKPLYKVTRVFLDDVFKQYAISLSNSPTKKIVDVSLSDYLNSIEDAEWLLSSVVQTALESHWKMSSDVASSVMTQFVERIGKTVLPKTAETIILEAAAGAATKEPMPPYESGISKIGELVVDQPDPELSQPDSPTNK